MRRQCRQRYSSAHFEGCLDDYHLGSLTVNLTLKRRHSSSCVSRSWDLWALTANPWGIGCLRLKQRAPLSWYKSRQTCSREDMAVEVAQSTVLGIEGE